MSSKRQRFFVEFREDEVTVVSWKKLLAEADRSIMVDTDVTGAPPPPLPPADVAPTGVDDEKNESLKPRREVKVDADERKMNVEAVKHEVVKPPIIKRKVHRTHNITPSRGAKLKQTKACFSCSKKTKRS